MASIDEKKVIILHNFDKTDYSKLLKSLNAAGLAGNTIVAVTTTTTLDWKVGHLVNELLLEDERLKREVTK